MQNSKNVKGPGKRFIIILKFALTALLLALIFQKVGIRVLIDRFYQIKPLFLVFALLPGILFTLLKAYKWHYLISLADRPCSYARSLESYLIGMAIGLITPGRIGEVGRVFYLKAGRKLESVGLVGVDKLLDLAVVFALSCAGGFLMLKGTIGFLFILLAAAILLCLSYPGIPIGLIKKILSPFSIRDKVQTILESMERVKGKPMAVSLAMTAAAYGLVLAEFYLLILGFEFVPIQPILVVFPLVMLTNILPVTIGGLGVREGTAAVLFSMFNVSEAIAVNAAFLIFFINTFLPGLIGALLLLKRTLFNRSVKT